VVWRERAIGQLLSTTATPGHVVLVVEISRMARSTLQVLEVLPLGMERQLYIHIAKQQMILDGSLNSRIMAAILGLAAEIERELIAARTREALARRRADGKPLGRPPGATSARLKLAPHADKIRRYVGKGLSKRSIAKLVGCAESTLYDWFARRRVSPPGPVIETRS
jgi:DNA invertase Pin-like site-specific DNA recombinase